MLPCVSLVEERISRTHFKYGRAARQTIVEAAGLLLLSIWAALSFMLVLDFGFGGWAGERQH